jgi:hypothetical protein
MRRGTSSDGIGESYQTAERFALLVTSWPATDNHLSRARGRAAKRIDAARKRRVWHPESTLCCRTLTRGASRRDLSHDVGEVMQARELQFL